MKDTNTKFDFLAIILVELQYKFVHKILFWERLSQDCHTISTYITLYIIQALTDWLILFIYTKTRAHK